MNSLKHITDWPAAGSSVGWKRCNTRNEYSQLKNKCKKLSWENDFDLESVNPYDYLIGYGHNYLCQILLNKYKIYNIHSLRKALDDYYNKNFGMENFSSVLERKGFFNRNISYEYSKSILLKKDDYSKSFLVLDVAFGMLSIFKDSMTYEKVNNFISDIKVMEEKVNYDRSFLKKEKDLTLKVLTTLKHSSVFWYSFFYNKKSNGSKISDLVIDKNRDPDKWIMSDAAGYMMGMGSSLHGFGASFGPGGYLAAVVGGMAASSIISVLGLNVLSDSDSDILCLGETSDFSLK